MSIQSSSGSVPPVVPPDDGTDDLVDRTTEDGQTVGAADAAEDARRAGADRDTPLRDTVEEGALDAGVDADRATDGGEAVGTADAEADRMAAGADDDRA
ncbi:hypothetical protein [Geodermatophilus sp. SYSU D00815]